MTTLAPQADDSAARAEVTKAEQRRAMGTASGAHALHDGYTDLIYVLLPVWQAEFGLGYAALGLLRTCYAGTMALLQVPAGMLSERLGVPLVLAGGTALAGIAYLIAGASVGFTTLVAALLLGGVGASVQHPLASALVARAYSGAQSMKALGAYNFAGDIGKMTVPAAASLMLVVLPWQPTVAILGGLGLVAAAAIFVVAPRLGPEPAEPELPQNDESAAAGAPVTGYGFPILLTIGVIDSATRMAFLTFLPFVVLAKGATLPTVGLALTLVFAGGAVGKLVCAFVAARIGVVGTVCLTEALTAAGVLAILPLPIEAAILTVPVIGVALNGTSSVLYGSVPVLVKPAQRTRAFSIFYTGTIGAGAIAPAIYGLLGDAVSVPVSLMVVAGMCLLTIPLAFALRPALPLSAR